MALHARFPVLLFSLVCFSFLGAVTASEVSRAPQVLPATPSKELAIRILSQRDERFAKDYTVALIMPGETEFQGIMTKNAASVTFFGPEIEEGKKRRVLSKETFFWNEEYGWFLCEFGERLGRSTIFIWSERKGEVEID